VLAFIIAHRRRSVAARRPHSFPFVGFLCLLILFAWPDPIGFHSGFPPPARVDLISARRTSTGFFHVLIRKPLQCALLLPIFRPHFGSGRSVAWLARLFRVQEVVSSNLTAPTICLPKGSCLTRTWRNWQTRYFEVVVPYGVQVQVLPCAPNTGSGTSSGIP
jgi:hypothetical protein